VGGIFSSDVFSLYSALPEEEGWVRWASMGCGATDMECFALYCNAPSSGKRPSPPHLLGLEHYPQGNEPQERQTSLNSMFDVAWIWSETPRWTNRQRLRPGIPRLLERRYACKRFSTENQADADIISYILECG
jgi:hypothetical protein